MSDSQYAQKIQPMSPYSSPSIPSTFPPPRNTDRAAACFRVWFELDRDIIHRREIPGNESYEGFCSQLESLFYDPGSTFDISKFEFILIGKHRYREATVVPFQDRDSYHHMRNKLLEAASPWRHANVRRIMTGVSALESYVRMRPMIDPYLPPGPNFTAVPPTPQGPPQQSNGLMTPPQPHFRWIPENPQRPLNSLQNTIVPLARPIPWDQSYQAAEAPLMRTSLPSRPPVLLPTGSQGLPAQTIPHAHSGSPTKRSPPNSSPRIKLRLKGPVRGIFKSPITLTLPDSARDTPDSKANDRILLSSPRTSSGPMLPSPLSQPTESAGQKRRWVPQSSSAARREPLPSSPLAWPKAWATPPTNEASPTLIMPIGLVDQHTTRSVTRVQDLQPMPHKRKYVDLSISDDDENEDEVRARGTVSEDAWTERTARKTKR